MDGRNEPQGGENRMILSQESTPKAELPRTADVSEPSRESAPQDPKIRAVDDRQKDGEAVLSPDETVASPKNGNKKTAHIVYVFDNNYAPIGGVSITSLFENNQGIDEINVYILTDGLSEENENKFKQLSQIYKRKITVVNISDKIEEFKEMGLKAYRGSYIPYLKMFCPDFFPEIDRMICIDADTVILRGIEALLDSDALLGMVKVSLVSFTGKTAGYEAPYNSEVMVFNTARWRNEGWSAKICDFIQHNGAAFLSADEGILNMVCGGEIVKLPLEYAFGAILCAMPKEDFLAVGKVRDYTPEEVAHAYDEPIVIHTGIIFGEKVWEKGTMHPAKRYFDPWLARSLWKDDFVNVVGNTGTLYSFEKWIYKNFSKRFFYKLWSVAQYYYVVKEMRRLRKENTK